MQREDLLDKIQELITPVLKKQDVELVETVFRRDSKGRLYLRLLVDKYCGGISLEECARLNQEIGNILDTTDLIENRYVLEISSPGVDRPLVNKKDFKRAIGRDVKLFLSEPIDGNFELTGEIQEVQDEFLLINTKTKTIKVSFEIITKGKQLIF